MEFVSLNMNEEYLRMYKILCTENSAGVPVILIFADEKLSDRLKLLSRNWHVWWYSDKMWVGPYCSNTATHYEHMPRSHPIDKLEFLDLTGEDLENTIEHEES